MIVLLLLSACAGTFDAIESARSASGLGQRIVMAGQFLYPGCSAAVLIAMVLRRSWVTPLLILWGAVLSVTGGLAAVFWGDTSALVGVFGGACIAVIAGLVIWIWRRCAPGPKPGDAR